MIPLNGDAMTPNGDRHPLRFHRDVLKLDPAAEVSRIEQNLRRNVLEILNRRGVVLGVSGGVDSAVCLALAVRALGPERTLALLLPERESSPESADLAREVCRRFGVEPLVENITGALLGFGCYRRRDEAVRRIVPEYAEGHKMKISLPGDLIDRETLSVFSLTVIGPDGEERRKRLTAGTLREIVAASNFKQRARAAMLYYHAETRDYAVLGTPPKNEHDLGFFVKYGDGAMDVKPIVHLYKTQVFALAEYLGVPDEVRLRPPTSDTYPAGSTQEEFFFRTPFDVLDLIWYGWENGVSPAVVAGELGMGQDQVERVYNDCARKIRTTRYLRAPALRCDRSIDDEGGSSSVG
jgi:NAD+ synthase